MASPIEKIFREIFGFLPAKPGTAYEQLAAIAMFVLEGGSAQHDARVRGEFSKTLFQIDVLHRDEAGRTTMVEAKDYSEAGAKVGRRDMQVLGGALPELKEVDSGAFFSATAYTKPAAKYADAADRITGGKPIRRYNLSASTEADERGFVKTIIVNVFIGIREVDKCQWTPHFTSEGEDLLRRTHLKAGQQSAHVSAAIDRFYDAAGKETFTLEELTSRDWAAINDDTGCEQACFWMDGGCVRFGDDLVPLRGLEFKCPVAVTHREIRITDDSKHRLAIRDEKGNALKILTDQMLREFLFDDEGNVIKD